VRTRARRKLWRISGSHGGEYEDGRADWYEFTNVSEFCTASIIRAIQSKKTAILISREADSPSAGQEICHLLWIPKVHYFGSLF
jgi:hypothetical protein